MSDLDDPEHEGDRAPRGGVEFYAREGTPCATCTRSFMTMKTGTGIMPGFDMGAGLTLRVCTKGRDPLVVEDGASRQLHCDDYRSFGEELPLNGDELGALQRECSRGFLGDLASGARPIPRTPQDLRWYDKGMREDWLPPHRVEASGLGRGQRISGPWEQFQVVGVTPAFRDGHTPAVGEAILQVKDQLTYLLQREVDAELVRGVTQPHVWWTSQVAAGAALPLEEPIAARRGYIPLVLRGGERVLSDRALRYLPATRLDEALDEIAEDSLRTARAALRRKNPVVVKLCVQRGLRARPRHEGLLRLQEDG